MRKKGIDEQKINNEILWYVSMQNKSVQQRDKEYDIEM